VVNLDGLQSIGLVDIDDFSSARHCDLDALQDSDVSEKFLDVVLSDRVL
jgi:hypothetical protein